MTLPGTTDPQPPAAPEPRAVVRRRRLLNRWSLFALVIVSAATTVLFVNNVIAVNVLLKETTDLERAVDSLKTVNQSLRSEIYRLQSAERITTIAVERLGMIPPPRAPIVVPDVPESQTP
ncbi:MAG: cell division protein FtsL [Candidatus Kapabacteria bacterium]|jgi:cell division protein FtsL|nr:cell division protein FtsL [Candidatus Kapabacteria bacterium]